MESLQKEVSREPCIGYLELPCRDSPLDKASHYLLELSHRLYFAYRATVEQGVMQLAFGEVKGGHLLKEPLEPLDEATRTYYFRHLARAPKELLRGPVSQGGEQTLLRVEVEVDRALGHACRSSYIVHRGR